MLRMGRRAAILLALVAAGCALAPTTPDGDPSHDVVIAGERFRLDYRPIDRSSAAQVESALEDAVPRLAKWGRFTSPIALRIQPSHAALEEAVHRLGYSWLRAWSRYDSIDLQSPRTWGAPGAVQSQLDELLTHELTHCLMYQRSANAATWTMKDIPLWFREGMASVTSRQGYRRPTDEDLWRWLNDHPGANPIDDADALYQSQSDVVYGAAHRAFAFLEARYGDDAIRRLMDEMHAGADFDEAFVRAIGLSVGAFTRDFLDYVRWEGWRGDPGARRPPLVPSPGAPSAP